MKVILIKNSRIGSIGDVVEVAGGYARNFLLPNSYCIAATKDNLNKLESIKIDASNQTKIINNLITEVVSALNMKFITFIRMASDDGILYGSIKNKDIANELNLILKRVGVDFKIETHSIFLAEPIKSLGIYKVNIEFLNNISCTVMVNACRNELDGEANVTKFHSSNETK